MPKKRGLEEEQKIAVAIVPPKRSLQIQQRQQLSEETKTVDHTVVKTSTSPYVAPISGMVTVTYSTIPEYLRASELYKNLQEGLSDINDNKEIVIKSMNRKKISCISVTY